MAERFVASVAMLLLAFAQAEYDVSKYCKLTQSGIKLPSLESCQNYYTCSGNGMAVKFTCPNTSVFDKDAQSCVPEATSNCYYGLSNPCYNKHKQFTYCSNGCNWYNYCLNGQIAGNGTCMVGQRFYAPNSTCIYGECDNGKQSDIQDICEIMPEGVFFGDFETCSAWHKCSAMNQINGLCEGSLVFDVVSGYCLQPDVNTCARTNNVVRGQASGPPQEPCTDAKQVAGDKNICSIYYTCEIATQIPTVTYQWKQRSCKNQYYDVISQTCSGPLVARAYPGCDRCELNAGYPRTYWTNAVDPNCAQYFTCSSGQKIGSGIRACKEGAFFDQAAQACVGSDERLEHYIRNNGACQNYTCNDLRVCTVAGQEENDATSPVSSSSEQSATSTANSSTANKTTEDKTIDENNTAANQD